MTEQTTMRYALSSEPWDPNTDIRTSRRGGILLPLGLAATAALVLAAFAIVGDDLDYSRPKYAPLPDPNNPGFDMYGKPLPQYTPQYPLDQNAETMAGQSGDGIAQSGERIGENGEGELTMDRERKEQLVKELVPVYQKAFAGPPWFEVSKCPTCPSGFSAQEVGSSCLKCGSYLTKEAYPTDELYRSLLNRVSRADSTVYIERTPDGRATLGAIFVNKSETEIVQNYVRRSDPELIRSLLPGQVAWLDEIFADLGASPGGNLKNLEQVVEKSAAALRSDTVAFRTINQNLLAKVQKIYGDRVQVTWVPDRGAADGQSALVVIKLR